MVILILSLLLGPTVLHAAVAGDAAATDVSFGRDIRPLLSDRCFPCHGPDQAARKARLRLDLKVNAMALRGDTAAVVPGDRQASLIWQRLTAADPDDRMPPADSGKHALTLDQVNLIGDWIDAGGRYEDHWSFTRLKSPDVPSLEHAWCRNEVDGFILSRAQAAGVTPNPPADRATLVRRLYLDLTGLPPTPAEVDAFVRDPSPDAYEQLIDTIFTQEPWKTRYAERMATPWLDLARYADTSGIHMDAGRSIWPYRNWVIQAYGDNRPFDQFIVDQLAGDVMDQPTRDQIIASGFNRCHVTTDEGGAINDEYLYQYAVDRTNTLGSVFLGLTVECAQCHDHKFDPITAEDYYGLLGFFNNNEEPGLYNQSQDSSRALEPSYEVITDEEQAIIDALEQTLTTLKAERDLPSPDEADKIATFAAELRSQGGWSFSRPTVLNANASQGVPLQLQDDGSLLATGAAPANDDYTIRLSTDETGLNMLLLECLPDASMPHGRVGRASNGNAIMSGISGEVISRSDPTQRRPLEFTWAWANIEQADGDYKVVNALRPDDGRVWALAGHQVDGPRIAMFSTAEPFGFEGGSEVLIKLNFHSVHGQHSPGRVRLHLGHANQEAIERLPTARTNWYIVGHYPTDSGEEAYDTAFGPEEAGPLRFDRTYGELAWRYAPGVKEAQPVGLAAARGAEYVGSEVWVPNQRTLDLSLGSDDGIQVYLDGELIHENRVNRGVAPDQDQATLTLNPGRNTMVFKIINTGGSGGIYHRELVPDDIIPAPALGFVLPEALVDEATATKASHAWRTSESPRFKEITQAISAKETDLSEIRSGIPTTMVMRERSQLRPTYVMMRGAYDQPDTDRPIDRSVPSILGSLNVEGTPDREDLARWLVGQENPLTARVCVNRLWALLFGTGIVETVENFGYQGAWPTHPQLLDWLAADFRNNGWDVQRTLKSILMSATYRQSSRREASNVRIDANNDLLHHYPRQRLTAEQIRDQALYVAGILIEEVGGPSVKPYQPEGLWKEVAMPQSNTRTFEQGMGSDLWRRSLYTYWKRAAPPPAMLTLDAPTREYCAPRRLGTNTPLQALLLWNDVQFVEAARLTAARVMREATTDDQRIDLLFRHCTGSAPEGEVRAAMKSAADSYRRRFAVDSQAAASLVSVGEAPTADDLPVEELAVWTMLANAVLSSDAAIVKD